MGGRPSPRDAGDPGDRRDLPRAGIHDRVRPRGRNRVVQLRRAELPARSSGDGRARHAVPRPRHAAPNAHVARPGAHDAAMGAAHSHSGARQRVSTRLLRPVARANVLADRRPVDRRGRELRGPQGHALQLRSTILRRREDALPSELFPVHGAIGRDGRAMRRVRRLGLPDLQRNRVDRDPRQRHGASRGARGVGNRQRALHRMGVRHGAGANRVVTLQHPRHSPSLRRRRALPRTDRAMNISYGWLKDFVDFDLTPAALADLITSRAATVDAVESLRDDLRQFVVARVVECARHPDSDHLSVTKVDAGTGELLDVVCGAANVQAGKLYPFARTGTKMPAGFTIERRKIRGAVSNGMLCSAREIGLGEDQDGILELDSDAAPGTPLLDALPSFSDSRIVVDVGANRPDLLSHLGVAREVAAAVNKPLQLDRAAAGEAKPVGARVAIASNARHGKTGDVSVTIEDVEGCPRYLGVVIRGVRVGPSPDWLARRLEGAGVRSINSIVDITNFMLLGFGQPMHAFDAKRLGASAVVVRRARKGEKLVTLDGVERQLTEDMCVIADGERAQALAGVMGGRDSEVTVDTTDVFLEVAAFNPRRVRQMRRALSISSEAAYR